MKDDNKVLLSSGNNVYKCGNVITRPKTKWSSSVFSLMRHFHNQGLPVPQVNSSNDEKLEVLEYIKGGQVHPNKWSDDGLHEIGTLVKNLHLSSKSYVADKNACWKPWYLRELGNSMVYSHGDIAPWNIITKNRLPIGIVDWEYAGPIDYLTELSRVCWLFPQLCDDDIAQMYNLGSPEERAKQVRIITDAYELGSKERQGFVDRIIETIICETAHEAIDTNVTFETEGNLWGMAWRARSLYWIWRNKKILEEAMI